MQDESISLVEHELLPLQSLILNDKRTKSFALIGGIGSGKTVFLCFWLHLKTIEHAGGNFWFASRTIRTAKDPGLKTYIALLKALGLKEKIHFTYTLNPLQIKYAWGSTVTFVSSEAYKDWVGASLAAAVGDEPAYYPEGAHTKLIERLRPGFKENEALQNKKFIRQLCLGGTPEGYTWYADEFSGADFEPMGVDLQVGEKKLNLVYKSETRDRIALHYPTYLNHKLIEQDPHFIKSLLADYGHDKALVRAHIFGQFGALNEDIVYHLKEANEVEKEKDPLLSDEVYLGFDFNIGKMAWVAGQKINGKLFYIEEAEEKSLSTFSACEDILRKFPPQHWKNHNFIIDGDASGYAGDTRYGVNDYEIIYQELSKHYNRITINAPRRNPEVRTRIMTTNRAISPNEAIGKEIDVFLSKNCRYTIEAIHRTVYNPKGTDINKPSDDRITHRSDAWSYSVIAQFPFTPKIIRQGQSW